MTTNRIHSPSALADLMAALSSSRTPQTRRNQESTGQSLKKPSHASRQDVEELRQRLGELARDADPTDTQAMQQTRGNLVREVLTWEFGDDFRNDRHFLPMVEAIGKAFDVSPSFQQQFLNLLADLRKA